MKKEIFEREKNLYFWIRDVRLTYFANLNFTKIENQCFKFVKKTIFDLR